MNGHWHSYSLGSGNYVTLDIEDSLVIIDKYNVVSHRLDHERFDGEGVSYLPVPNEINEFSYDYYLDGDTLVAPHSFRPYRYFRSDANQCRFIDRYALSTIEISLMNVDSANTFSEYGSGDLLIGRLRKGRNLDSLSDIYPDSIFIQFQNVWIRLNDVGDVCARVYDLYTINTPQINLHTDKVVPDSFVTNVLRQIPDSMKVQKVVRMTSGDIGLLEINR